MRDPSAVERSLRDLFDRAGMPWASAQTFRRTAATLIAESGLSIVAAANQQGHADASMTARRYPGRRGGNVAAAGVL